jgi:hypothetical protein
MNSAAISPKTTSALPFLYGKIERMPIEMQKEILLFTEFLLSKTSSTCKPKYGALKGKIKLAADFDAPLSDFEEYMQ